MNLAECPDHQDIGGGEELVIGGEDGTRGDERRRGVGQG